MEKIELEIKNLKRMIKNLGIKLDEYNCNYKEINTIQRSISNCIDKIHFINVNQLDFSHSIQVKPCANKFIIPLPYIESQTITFRNNIDNCLQTVATNGQTVIIINNITNTQAKTLLNMVPKEITPQSLMDLIEFAQNMLGLMDIYNSDTNYIVTTLQKSDNLSTPSGIGLYKPKSDIICQAIYVSGNGSFNGPAASPQHFGHGAIFLKSSITEDEIRLIQPQVFLETYTFLDGSPINSLELFEC